MTTEAKATPLGANYWKLWTGSVVSNFGDGISAVAYPWLASAVTRDPIAIALVGLATRLPWMLFTLPAGVITDRVDRRKLVMWMDMVRFTITVFVAFAVLTQQGSLTAPGTPGSDNTPTSSAFLLGVLYVSGLAFGMAEVLRDNAAQTLLPAIVHKEQLQRANGRLWGAEAAMNQFAGPVAAGFLLAVAFSLPFFVDAGTFAVAAAMTFLVAGDFRPKGEAPPTTFRADMKEGFVWLWHRPLLRSLAISLGVLNALGAATMATLVLFAQEVIELDARGFGILMWAGAIGGILGSVTAEKITVRLGNGPTLFSTIVGGAVTSAVIGFTSELWVVFAMFLVGSVTAVLWNVITVSLRQTIIPDHLLGRVNSVYRMFGWGMMPIGSLAGGALVTIGEAIVSRTFGLRLPFFVAAGAHVLLLVYAVPRLNSTRIRDALQGAGTT